MSEVYDPDKSNLDSWADLVAKQSKGMAPDDFTWHTPEGIPLKTLYTAADLEGLEYTDTMPGMSPYIRGPMATMYAGRRWTILPIRRLLNRRGIQCLLSQGPCRGWAGHFSRL